MRQTLIVSSRGQITLPADIRKQFGIKSGAPVIIEDRNGELVLKPAVVVEVEMYSTEQIAEWDRQDQLNEAERKAVLARLPKRRPAKAPSKRA
jgi:AbrB family looped-hinge helix DNA binding protein